MNDLNSDASDGEPEYLMTTRERRSNAGNKMRALLEREVEEVQQRTQQFDQDEVDLLFQEDENDEDFEVESKSRRKSRTGEKSGTMDEEDMLFSSESDNNEEIEDDYNEEEELQRQERLQRKKKQKQKRTTIIKRKNVQDGSLTGDEPIKKKSYASDQLNPESLLHSERRTSKRSSVVANKLKVYEKLSQAEEKRKIIRKRLRENREKATQHILTQEDRMRIALETEKFNLLSLNKYKEQELSKKQTRLALQQRRKLKFKPQEVIQELLSTTWNVEPIMEIEDGQYWDMELKKREKKKRKYVRKAKKKDDSVKDETNKEVEDKSKKEMTTEASTNAKLPVENNTEMSLSTDGQPEQDNNRRSFRSEEEYSVESINEINDDILLEKIGEGKSEGRTEGKPDEVSLDGPVSESQNEMIKYGLVEETEQIQSNITPPKLTNIEDENVHTVNKNVKSVDKMESALTPEIDMNEACETITHISDIDAPGNLHKNDEPETIKKQVTFDNNPQIAIIANEHKEVPEIGDVSGLASPSVSSASSEESTPLPDSATELEDEEEPQLIYEGPVQQISRNFMTKYIVAPDYSFTSDNNRTTFFDYLNTSKYQFSNDSLEPVLRSRLSDSDVLLNQKGTDKEDLEIVPNLDILTTFRKFGEFDRKYVKVLKVVENKNNDLKIITPAPMGIYANNNTVRKHCLINNKSCEYFDPKLGVPYSDLNSYKIIQDLQNGSDNSEYKWFGFRNGGIYLKVKGRHAKGVPEGF